MKKLRAIKQDMAISFRESEFPRPDDLLEAAKHEAARPELLCAVDYVPVMKILRDKGFFWVDIMEWLQGRGVEWSASSLRGAYRDVYGPLPESFGIDGPHRFASGGSVEIA